MQHALFRICRGFFAIALALVGCILLQGNDRTTAPPEVAKAPFDAAAAGEYQDVWADYLGLQREITNSIGMRFALIPPGEFMMGSPESERGHREEGGPQHLVRITKPFYIGVSLVTQHQYRQVMGGNPSFFAPTGEGKQYVAGLDCTRFPVDTVCWNDAVEFCRKLSELPDERAHGRSYRLPTEAQWEYACRAGTTSPFNFGDCLNGCEANCNGNFPYGTRKKGLYLGRPCIVGSYRPNAFGLFDMHGNVWQWCSDRYDDYSAGLPTDDPVGPATGSDRVARGGCWDDKAVDCRSASRGMGLPGYSNSCSGFRVSLRVVRVQNHVTRKRRDD